MDDGLDLADDPIKLGAEEVRRQAASGQAVVDAAGDAELGAFGPKPSSSMMPTGTSTGGCARPRRWSEGPLPDPCPGFPDLAFGGARAARAGREPR